MDPRFAVAAGTAPAFRSTSCSPAIAVERRYAAHNYDPLPVVLAHGDGFWLWDKHGRRYLDMMSAYSAVSHGHAHPRLVRALVDAARVGLGFDDVQPTQHERRADGGEQARAVIGHDAHGGAGHATRIEATDVRRSA